MIPPSLRRAILLAAVPGALLSGACINVFYQTTVRSVDASRATADTVRAPLKAHLSDGSTVIFHGAVVSRTAITALPGKPAQAYPLLDSVSRNVTAVPVDSVVGLEAFEGSVQAAPTIAVSLAGTAFGMAAGAALFVALFGSCPTVYADSGGRPALQAEGFSYAIAPLFERRDLDRIRVAAGPDGIVRLELRNEALETHYINYVALRAVRHAAGALAVPDQRGRPVVVEALRVPASAVDRDGRDVLPALREADGVVFASDTAGPGAADSAGVRDWIDLAADSLPPGDSVAVVLRLRNSLLNTVLLYDGMLRGPGAAQWLLDINRPADALALAQWYIATMGMNVGVLDSSAAGRSVHLGDVGPIAFRDVAVVLPRPRPGASRVRLRLEFPRDNWRIDQVRIAGIVAPAASRELPLRGVVALRGGTGVPDTAALAAMSRPDTRHLATLPGQRMTLEFAVAPAPADSLVTTYFLDWQGWYNEWLRPGWVRAAGATPFVPGRSALLEAMRRWQAQRSRFERVFYSSRIGAP